VAGERKEKRALVSGLWLIDNYKGEVVFDNLFEEVPILLIMRLVGGGLFKELLFCLTCCGSLCLKLCSCI
jgi:hypothetical protein